MRMSLRFVQRCHSSVKPSLICSFIVKASYSAAGSKWEGGVSMVQGASRGIGFEFVKQLLESDQKGHVVATCRTPDHSSRLLDLKDQYAERLNILKLDVTDENTIEEAAKSIGEKYGHLDLLINTSGVLSIPNVMQPETTLTKVQKSSLMLAYEVNAVGPILVIKHMWPLLKVGGGFGARRSFAVVANLSARVGSIGDNHLGGWHAYRASKTALNQFDAPNYWDLRLGCSFLLRKSRFFEDGLL